MKKRETIIISLGGAVVVPDVPNGIFVKEFKNLILKWVEKGKNFVIIVGGGKTCRQYNSSLKEAINPTNDELDWMGIYTTRLNSEFVRIVFGKDANNLIVTNPKNIKKYKNKNVVIGAGWQPGCSTDTVAVLIAKEIGAKKVINLSNIDYIYDSDPKINKSAKKFEQLSWKEYRSFITSSWDPGLNTPFDPIASEKADKMKLEVAFMSGQNLLNLDSYLSDQKFQGTIIK